MSRSGSKKNRQPITLNTLQIQCFNDFNKVLGKGEIKSLELQQALSIRLKSTFKINDLHKYSDELCKKVLKELNYM